jgi:hypothetical protein
MKKILFIGFSIILFSCVDKPKQNQGAYSVGSSTPIKRTDIIIDSIHFKFGDSNSSYQRIITSKMVFNAQLLSRAIDSLKVKQSIIYFHIPTLTDSGEEYACEINKEITIDKNAPKTKTESILRIKSLGIDTQIESINLFLKNGVSFNDINIVLNSLSIIEDDFNLLKPFSDDVKVKSKIAALKNKISQIQVKVYPKLRKAFFDEMKRKMWAEDINVKMSGRNITLIGAIYASNRNIQSSFEALDVTVTRLRFSRVYFKWYDGDGGHYYTLNTPADSVVE